MDSFIELFAVSPLVLVVLFFVAILAGFIDSLAGGGGLLTVPALMAAGMPPAQALATNKLQACGGSLSATLYFVRRKVVSLADQKLNILMTFIGSTAGALLVQHVQSDILKQILPLLVIGIGLYFLLMPKLGLTDAPNAQFLGVYLGLWGVFTLFMFFGTLKGARVLQFVFFSLTVLFALLAIGNIAGNAAIIHFAGWIGLICGASAIYLAMGEVLNEQFGRTVLPIGESH